MTSKPINFSSQVKSRLLPLSLLESILEWLVERLPRKQLIANIVPSVEILVISEARGEYISLGNSPSFELSLPTNSIFGSWYYIEAALVRNNGNREACISACIDMETKKNITIPIPTNLRGTVREVFYLPPGIKLLHWIPTTAHGHFSQSPLLIHKITLLESICRRMYRVAFDIARYKNTSTTTLLGLTWCRAICNLHEAYQLSANLRIKRLLSNDYAIFIAHHDTLKESDIQALQMQVTQLSRYPTISLIMCVHSISPEFFKEAVDSIANQIYPHWELLLVGNFSDNKPAHEIAIEYQRKHYQVKIISINSNADSAIALNRALAFTTGEFVSVIKQHDKIPSHALICFAQEISNNHEAGLIYSDYDCIDESSERKNPNFKPDWNPDLFLSYNYLNNLALLRLTHVQALGGYREGFAGAEEYDLILRYIKKYNPQNVVHIPKVLYHARTLYPTTESTRQPDFSNSGEIETQHQSGKRALQAYFEGSDTIIADGCTLGLYRIKHPLPAQLPLVTIIVTTRDMVNILSKCIESIQEKTDYTNWELLIVDNQSVHPETLSYFEQITSDTRIRVIKYPKPFNYSAMNNYAVEHAKGEVLALLNNDVEVITTDWLTEMVSHAIRPEIGAVGAKLLYSNGLVQHAGVIIGLGGVAGHAHKYLKGDDFGYCYRAVTTQNLSAVTGACLVVRKNNYLEVAGLDEHNLTVAFNDIDFCLKLRRAGYLNVFTPYAKLFHHESISRGADDTPKKHARFTKEFEYMKKTWGTNLHGDPAYNPNLTLEFENFSFK